MTWYSLQIRKGSSNWKTEASSRAKNGEKLMGQRMADRAAELSTDCWARVIVSGLDGDYGRPERVIAILQGQWTPLA